MRNFDSYSCITYPVGILFFLILLLGGGGLNAKTYTSVQDGSWLTSSTWDQSDDPTCTVTDDVVIKDSVTCSCDPLDIKGTGSVTVDSGGYLEITSSTGVTGDGDLTVKEGGELVVDGNMDLSGSGSLTVDGSAEVGGDLNVSGSATADGSGSLTLGGSGCSNWSGSGSCSETLPIELLYFEAEAVGDKVRLRWRTATERSNEYFTIERSTNGKDFETIARVEGAGTSTTPQSYEHYDPEPQTGVTYYRLRQTDVNGDSEVSDPTAVRYAGNEDSINVYPNPISSTKDLNLELNGFDGEVLVVLRGVHGKKYHSKVIPTNKSRSAMTAIDLNERIPSGIYFVVASSNDRLYRKRVVIE